MKLYRHLFKRLLDFVISWVLFFFLLPFFLLITGILTLANSGKPFFFQDRPGKSEKIFRMIKFRTMNEKKDSSGTLLPDNDRLTKIGKFIRSTSLDEIPQLINVIKGDMSLIGPRPLLVKYLERYSPEQRRRHEVRPGITGWAQVNGRNAIAWEDRFQLDLYYVENCSFWLDMKIIFLTLLKVIKREGISPNASDTVEEFKG